jgi:hypothetical protein
MGALTIEATSFFASCHIANGKKNIAESVFKRPQNIFLIIIQLRKLEIPT